MGRPLDELQHENYMQAISNNAQPQSMVRCTYHHLRWIEHTNKKPCYTFQPFKAVVPECRHQALRSRLVVSHQPKFTGDGCTP